MNKTSGRNDNKSLRDVGDIEHDLAEELDLNVDMTVKEGLKFADTGGAPSWNKGAATDNKYNGKIDEVIVCFTNSLNYLISIFDHCLTD